MRSLYWTFLGLSLAACAPRSEGKPLATPEVNERTTPVVLSIMGSNDLHGELDTLPIFAGYVARMRELRKSDGALILVDAGDMFQGTLESNIGEGAGVIEVMNQLRYTVAALGNHDFDYGARGDEPNPDADPQGALRARLAEAKFPVLSSNLTLDSRAFPDWKNLARSVMRDISGVKVGFVGALTEETPSIVLSSCFAGLGVAPLAASVATEARSLRKAGARVVILVAHAGGECQSFDDPRNLSSCDMNAEIVRAARALPDGLVDVIISGHTHHAMAHFVGKTAIANSWARGRAFSRVDVSVPPRSDAPLDIRIFPPKDLCERGTRPCVAGEYEGGPIYASGDVTRTIAHWMERAVQVKARALGPKVTSTIASHHDRESALGNLMADLTLAVGNGADLGLVNAGGLRSSLPAGDLTYGALYRVTPFDNQLALVRITAGELARRFEAHLTRDAHGIVSVSGIRVEARCSGGKLQVHLLRLDGKPIESSVELRIATSDFLAGGGDDLLPADLPSTAVELLPPPNLRDRMAEFLVKDGKPLGEKLMDPRHPRLILPGPRPVKCDSQ
jgi:2',3'-cyclic-nucleotide 2'-phosphodiesterase (5'-nucleotidase family)